MQKWDELMGKGWELNVKCLLCPILCDLMLPTLVYSFQKRNTGMHKLYIQTEYMLDHT